MCLLKINKELASFNEDAYPGVDLLDNILQLLFYFRNNQLVLLGDVKQAFLINNFLKMKSSKIGIASFGKGEHKLVTYWFKSIVFGIHLFSLYITICNETSWCHCYPDDKLSKILAKIFSIDNLLVAGNEFNEIKDLYHPAYEKKN